MYKVFIASSSEGKGVAEALARACASIPFLAPRPWWEPGVFKLSEQSLVSLIKAIKSCDLGFFVATPDDLSQIRNELLEIPRANVVFEFGLFAGINGLNRSAYFQIGGSAIASDLQGLTVIRLPLAPTSGDASELRKYDEEIIESARRASIELLNASTRSPSILAELHTIEDLLDSRDFVPILQQKKKDDFEAVAFAPIDPSGIENLIERHREPRALEVGLSDKRTIVSSFFEVKKMTLEDRKILISAMSERIAHCILEGTGDAVQNPVPTCAIVDVNDDLDLLVPVADFLGLRPVLVDPNSPVHIDGCIGFSVKQETAVFLHDFTISGNTPLKCIARTQRRGIRVSHVFTLLARAEFSRLSTLFSSRQIVFDALLQESPESGVSYRGKV